MTLIAFHGDANLKKALLAEVKMHEEQDQIVAGTYGKQNGIWKGCAVGCSIHSLANIQGRGLNTSDHMLFESEAGVPVMLARLQDAIFEGLPEDKRAAFPRQFWSAIRPGADLSTVGWKFLHWLQLENLKFAKKQKMPADVIAAIKQCADVLVPLTKGQKVVESAAAAWSAESAVAARSAESAARSAAWSARSAVAARSARSAGSAAESAVWSAARSAESAAWSAAYLKMSRKLISLLRAA